VSWREISRDEHNGRVYIVHRCTRCKRLGVTVFSGEPSKCCCETCGKP
jgi:hypothetical protein